MPYSETFWLTVTNLALGVAVGLCALFAVIGLGQEVVVRLERRSIWREIDHDMCELSKITATMDGPAREEVMKTQDVMTRDVKSCSPEMTLARATEILRRTNCGILPVVDSRGKLAGVITDRDICFALSAKNVRPSALTVGDVGIKPVIRCGPEDEICSALHSMRVHGIRRIPVTAEDDGLVGIVSLDDVALHAEKAPAKGGISYEDVAETLKAICAHRTEGVSAPQTITTGSSRTRR